MHLSGAMWNIIFHYVLKIPELSNFCTWFSATLWAQKHARIFQEWFCATQCSHEQIKTKITSVDTTKTMRNLFLPLGAISNKQMQAKNERRFKANIKTVINLSKDFGTKSAFLKSTWASAGYGAITFNKQVSKFTTYFVINAMTAESLNNMKEPTDSVFSSLDDSPHNSKNKNLALVGFNAKVWSASLLKHIPSFLTHSLLSWIVGECWKARQARSRGSSTQLSISHFIISC